MGLPQLPEAASGPKPSALPRLPTELRELEGIRGFLPPFRRHRLDQFSHEYETIRRAEGREFSPAQYRALPFLEASSRRSGEWGIRAATFRTFQSTLQNGRGNDPSRCEPVIWGRGTAGCPTDWRWKDCRWRQSISSRTASTVSGAAAITVPFSFAWKLNSDRLPFQGDQFDLAVFNASLHYSTDYRITLRRPCVSSIRKEKS